MRLVSDLSAIYFCPNCGSPVLMTVLDPKTRQLQELFCAKCHETIKQGNIIEDTSTIANIPIANIPDKKQFIANLRADLINLKHYAHDVNTAQLVDNINYIFSQIIDYIENN